MQWANDLLAVAASPEAVCVCVCLGVASPAAAAVALPAAACYYDVTTILYSVTGCYQTRLTPD